MPLLVSIFPPLPTPFQICCLFYVWGYRRPESRREEEVGGGECSLSAGPFVLRTGVPIKIILCKRISGHAA